MWADGWIAKIAVIEGVEVDRWTRQQPDVLLDIATHVVQISTASPQPRLLGSSSAMAARPQI
jgi:hypothetical protein